MCIDRHGRFDPIVKIDISTENVEFQVLRLVEHVVLITFL